MDTNDHLPPDERNEILRFPGAHTAPSSSANPAPGGFRPITPGDFGVPDVPPLAPLRRAVNDDRPVPLFRLLKEQRAAQRGSQNPRFVQRVVEAQAAQAQRPAPPPPACTICRDTGFCVPDLRYDHPDFGKLLPCRCKRTVQQARHEARMLRWGLLRYYRDRTFETFDLDQNPSLMAVTHSASMFARAPGHHVFCMAGAYGVGKTHLAAAIANVRLDAGDTVIMDTVPDLLDYLRRTFDPTATRRQYDDAPTETYQERLELMRSCDLLVLDDLGTENGTPWAREKLFQLVEHRVREGLPLVITTNRDIRAIDARIRSRTHYALYQDRVWVLLGRDRRRDTVVVGWEAWTGPEEDDPPLRDDAASAFARGEEPSAAHG